MTQDEIIEMASPAKWVGCDHGWTFNTYKQLDAFAKRIAQHAKAEEREECAVDADWCIQNHLEHHIPERIRARGQA
jgi:hypothetical protein